MRVNPAEVRAFRNFMYAINSSESIQRKIDEDLRNLGIKVNE